MKTQFYLPASTGKKVCDPSQILYCKDHGTFITFYLQTTNGKVPRVVSALQSLSMREKRLLCEYPFVRIHERFIVNIEHARTYETGGRYTRGTLTMDDDSCIPVSHAQSKLLNDLWKGRKTD